MAFKSLSQFISALEDAGELIRVKGYVSPKLEIPEIVDRFSKHRGKALLFENNGTEFPLLINAFGSERRMCMALGVERLDDIGKDIEAIVQAFLSPKETLLAKMKTLPLLKKLSSWMPRLKKGKGECQEVVMEVPDLTRLPVLTCWPADGGSFITLPCVHTVSPQLAVGNWQSPVTSHQSLVTRNLGMYRMQVFGPDLTGMHWHPHKGSAHHYQKYRKLGKRMPVSVTLGGDPVYTYVATAPLPDNLDEYILAGFLRKKRVELVRCLTNELEVPADVDFVIEGYVDPNEELILEGPFGDHTGFYSLADYFPRFHVTCITHRKGAIYPATIVGIPPQEDGWIGKATERIFLPPLKMSVAPELTDMHMPMEGVFHNLVLISLEKRYAGQAEKVMNALWGAGQMMFNKILIAVNPDVELTNYREVARAVSRHADPLKKILFSKGPLDILDHASQAAASGSKLGIDATREISDAASSGEELVTGQIDKDKIGLRFPEITGINDTLLNEGISVVIIAFRKALQNHCRMLAKSLADEQLLKEVRFVVFVDQPVDPMHVSSVVWLAANNLDPVRDCFILEQTGGTHACLFLDASRKTKELDGFTRAWPNVIVMDDATIRTIDERWSTLGLGPYIVSPSVQYKSLNIRGGAIS
ncbi:MAG: menaquinone biosynthesis decarboxylase [bacterium]